MRRGDLGDLTAFVAIADHLSFRAAALRLGITPSALSHAMRQLEERLGVRLLHRTTRSVSLTDAGLRLLERLRPAIDQITGALENLKKEQQRPFGRLRVHALHFAAAVAIAPVWGRFLGTYPEVHLELCVEQAVVDIVAKGFDAGIAPRDRLPPDMVAVPVTGPLKMAAVGTATYFARRRPPRTPDDLGRHSCVQFRLTDGTVFAWPFTRNGKSRRVAVEGPVMVNDPDFALRGALAGLGIAYLPEVLVTRFLQSGELIRVLEDWSPSIEGFYLYYPSRRHVPAALRALIDLIRGACVSTAKRSLQNPFVGD